MATIGELFLALRGDAKEWTSATKEAETSLRNLVKEAEKAGYDLSKFSEESLRTFAVWGKDSPLYQAEQTFQKALGPVKQGLVDQGSALDVNQKGITTLATKTLVANANFALFAKSLNSLSSKLWVLTMGLKQAGYALTAAFTVPIAGIATVAVKTFADWEQGTKNLQASADMTSKEAENMTANFRELAMVMPLTVKELLEVSRAAAEAGVSTKNLERFTIAIAKVVTISDELNPKQVAELLVGINKAFGITEENVERTLSVIRKAAKESRGGMNDFIDALLRTLPAAAAFNISFTDMTAILAAVIPVSGGATRAGTQLVRMFDQMTVNLDKMAGQMGITKESLKEMMGKDVIDTLKQYIEYLGLSGDMIENNQAVLEVFTVIGARALRLLIDQYPVFLEKQKELGQSFIDGTELTNDYNIAADTLQNTFKRFRNAVLEVAKVIGDDLNVVIRPVLEKAITVASTLASIWIGIPNPIKAVAIALAGILAILGPLVLLLNTLISPIVGLVTFTAKAVAILVAFKTAGVATAVTLGGVTTTIGALAAGMGQFILIAVAVVGSIILIYKALDKLFDITDRLKKALGLKGVEDRFAEIKKKVAGALEAIEESATEAAAKAAIGFIKMAGLAIEWGDNVMLSFLKGFTQADFSILNDSLKVFESYFKILEEQGKLTTEGVLANTLEARRALSVAIIEAKSLGVVTAETQRRIEALVGAARTKDIIGQILAEIKVTQIQDTIDALNEEIKARRKALKRETDIIDDAIKASQRLYGDQIDSEEDQVKALQKRKRLLEKTYKTQLKALEATVETAQGEKDAAKDRLDIIKENNDVFIDNLKEQKDALQKNVDKTKETLQDLRDLRDEETDVAEGMLDYAKMNLESARNQLKKEQVLGRDEFDASYRAALERTSAAEDQVDLAYASYIRTKQLYAKEEKTLKAELKEEEKAVDLVQDQIEAAQKAAKQQEKLYQAQVDVAEDTLKAAKKALDVFKDAYADQSDALQEEIDIRREHIDDLQDAREEILDNLRKERDIISDKYEKEINLMEDRVSSAEDSLKASKKLLEAQKGINDQWLAIEKERMAAYQEMTGGTKYPGIAGGEGGLPGLPQPTLALDEVNKGLDETLIKLNELDIKAPTIFERIGKALSGVFPPLGLAGIGIDLVKIGEELSKGWETVKKWGKTLAENISTGVKEAWWNMYDAVKNILGGIWSAISEKAVEIWEWGKLIGQNIVNGIKNKWWDIYDAVKNILGGVGSAISDKASEIWEWGKLIAQNVANGIKNKWWELYDAMKNILGGAGSSINDKMSEIWEWGKSIGQNIVNGILNKWWQIYDAVKNILGGGASAINDKASEIWNWGKSIGQNIANGVYGAWDAIKNAASWVASVFKSFLGWFSPPEKGPMSEGDEWMPNMIKTLAEGIKASIPTIEGAVSAVGNTIMGIKDISPQPVIGTQFTQRAEPYAQGVAAPTLAFAPAEGGQGGVNIPRQVININPGMMIASKGEIRSFVRLLEDYTAVEKTRTGLPEG